MTARSKAVTYAHFVSARTWRLERNGALVGSLVADTAAGGWRFYPAMAGAKPSRKAFETPADAAASRRIKIDAWLKS